MTNLKGKDFIHLMDFSKEELEEIMVLAEKMKRGEMQGTFYVNIVNKKADATDLVTKNKCYYPY